MKMSSFIRGDQVEVCCKDEGFNNSFYPATIISEINSNEFIIQYNTLLREDELDPEREFHWGHDLRPVPPIIAMNKFDVNDDVDAYVNEGWWKGKITKKLNGRAKSYFVTFEGNGEVEVGKYWFNELRVHQDWIQGNWSSSKKNFQLKFLKVEF